MTAAAKRSWRTLATMRATRRGAGVVGAVGCEVRVVMFRTLHLHHWLKSSALTGEDRGMSALTVSDVARDAGVAPSAVRFYEAHGVITAERTVGGASTRTQPASSR
ncbi:hypothetical protein GCM10027268_15400 [Brachybacterium huguangmaarense]